MHRGLWQIAMMLVIGVFPDARTKKPIKLHRSYALPLSERQQRFLDRLNEVMEYAKKHPDTEDR